MCNVHGKIQVVSSKKIYEGKSWRERENGNCRLEETERQ